MLTPARPVKSDPIFEERMKQFRMDTKDKKEIPQNWGMVEAGLDNSAPHRTKTPRKGPGKK